MDNTIKTCVDLFNTIIMLIYVNYCRVPPMTCPNHSEMVGLRYWAKGKLAYSCGKDKRKPCGHIEPQVGVTVVCV